MTLKVKRKSYLNNKGRTNEEYFFLIN